MSRSSAVAQNRECVAGALNSDHSIDSMVQQEYSADTRAMQHSVYSRAVQF